MVKRFYEYDVFVPRYTNEGRPISPRVWSSLRESLTRDFGGVTEIRHKNIGRWKVKNFVYIDELVIFRVLTAKSARSQKIVSKLKKELEQRLNQKEILVVRRDVFVV